MRERRLYEKVGNKMQRQEGFLATNLDPSTNRNKGGIKL